MPIESERANPKLLLFDIDGTLVLTGGAGIRAMKRAFEGIFHVTNDFAEVPMPGRTDSIILHDALASAQLEVGTRLPEFRTCYEACLREEIEQDGPRKGIMAGVHSLLERLTLRSDIFLALLTGNFCEAARIKLEHFNLWRYFSWGVFGEEAMERNHLLPLAITRAQQHGMPPVPASQVFVIGDTPNDVVCAKSGGAQAIAVATGSYTMDALRASGADVVLQDLRDADAFMRVIDGGGAA